MKYYGTIANDYDIVNKGYVDNKVQTDVPLNAKFTDTVYSHPSTHPASMITGLPTSLPADGGNADTVGGFTVGVNVPAGAVFTDTKTTINGKTGAIAKADIVALGIPAQDTVYTHPTTHPYSMITGTPTSLPASGGHALSATHLLGDDTRAVNSAPSVYMSGGARYASRAGWQTEFKTRTAIDSPPLSGTYVYLQTYTPWSDPSGGYPIQVVYGNGTPCWRVGVSTSAWSAWQSVNDNGNASTVNGFTVGTNVPVNAKFTDTVYSHPASHPASMITESSTKRFVSDSEKTAWNDKWDYNENTIAAVTVNNASNADLLDGKDASAFSLSGHTHTVTNITDLTATVTELNYSDGVTSNIQTQLNSKASLSSPALTGTPTAPTATAGTNTTQLATTAFVQAALSTSGYGDMLKSVYDTNGDGIVDNAEKVGGFTVAKSVPANAVFTDTTYSVATTSTNGLMSSTDKTKFDGIATGANNYSLPVATSSILGGVKSGTDITVNANGNISVNDDSHNHIISNVDGLQTALNAKAPLKSPVLTGSPKSPTPSVSSNDTRIATTAFVQSTISALGDLASITVSASQPSGQPTGAFWFQVV